MNTCVHAHYEKDWCVIFCVECKEPTHIKGCYLSFEDREKILSDPK